jgi:hypothetical protein
MFLNPKNKMSAIEPVIQEYAHGNTRHKAYTYPDEKSRNAWTLLVGEDQPRVYHELLAKFVRSNLVGRAVTFDLSDEDGIVKLLSTGKARLGDRDAFADVEGVDPHLVFVFLDVKDDTLGKDGEFRGIHLAERLRPLVDGRVVHVTVHPEEHLDADKTVAGKHKLGRVFSASKGADGSLTKETCAQLEQLLKNAKATYGCNSFVIQSGSFKLVYETPDGKTKTMGPWPASPCVLAMHWLLGEKALLIEHMAMYCGLQEGGPQRRNQQDMFQDYENWENRNREKSLDAPTKAPRPNPKREQARATLVKQLEEARDKAASDMQTACDDMAANLAFNLIAMADESGAQRRDILRQIEALRKKLASDPGWQEWLRDKNRDPNTKAHALNEQIEHAPLLYKHLSKLESNCYLQMLEKLAEQYITFVEDESLLTQAFDALCGDADVVSEDGFQWVSARVKKLFSERKAEHDTHHNTWTICNQDLQAFTFPDQYLLSENPSLKNPLKSSGNVDKLRKDFVKLLKKCGHIALARHFETAIHMHGEKMFYGHHKEHRWAWQLSPSAGPMVPTTVQGFEEQPFYRRWKEHHEQQTLASGPRAASHAAD